MHRAPANTAYNSVKDNCGWGCIMEIGLTEAVRKMASAGALPPAQEGELLFCWDLARVDLGQRKLLAASNAATRLCAITRMAAADWKRIGEVAFRLVEDAAVAPASTPCATSNLPGRRASARPTAGGRWAA